MRDARDKVRDNRLNEFREKTTEVEDLRQQEQAMRREADEWVTDPNDFENESEGHEQYEQELEEMFLQEELELEQQLKELSLISEPVRQS